MWNLRKTRVALVASMLVVGLANAAPMTRASALIPTVDVTNDHLDCGSVYGYITFDTPLQMHGTTPLTGRIHLAADTCTDLDNPPGSNGPSTGLELRRSITDGTFTAPSNDCTALYAPNAPVAGSMTIRWAAQGYYTDSLGSTPVRVPRPTDTVNGYARTTITFSEWSFNVVGSTSAATDASGHSLQWGNDAPGLVEFGTDFGTADPTVTGAFSAGPANLFLMTGPSVDSLLTSCSRGSLIQRVTIGDGHLKLG